MSLAALPLSPRRCSRYGRSSRTSSSRRAVHMNGRVQDAVTGRFLSADPYVPDPSNAQDYNRYSYVNSNPLTYMDPSGFDDGCPPNGCLPNNPSVDPNNTVTVTGSNDQTQDSMGDSAPTEGNSGSSESPSQERLETVTVLCCHSHTPQQQPSPPPPLPPPTLVFVPLPQITPPQTNPTTCPNAQAIDDYLNSKKSPMVGQGANFTASGNQYNLDPRLLVALAGAETSFGKNITAGQYNALNVLYNGFNSPFASYQSNINSAAYSITNPNNGYDLTNTATMYSTYCSGPGCSAGLQNLNTFMNQQGADTSALNYPSNCP